VLQLKWGLYFKNKSQNYQVLNGIFSIVPWIGSVNAPIFCGVPLGPARFLWERKARNMTVYDGDSAQVLWWQYDSTMAKHESTVHHAIIVLSWRRQYESTMITIWQYDGDSVTVRWWQYDDNNMTVRWWQYDSTLVTVRQYDGMSPSRCRVFQSYWSYWSYCHTVTIVLSCFALSVLRENALALTEQSKFYIINESTRCFLKRIK
jgi:translation initiation factor IF-1